MNNEFPKKGVLLDLAREKDSLESIFSFFDVVSKAGFNTVFLYLEDRIKTKSYPYRTDGESYLPEEIKEMVAYADKCGLELIPQLTNLAHTERFLEHKELQHLSECRNNVPGRFHSTVLHFTSCPVLPESHNFYDAYFREVLELFPSKYMGGGMDEARDLGTCECCKKAMEENGGLGQVLLNHIIRTNELANSLGKTMFIANDMVESYPEILPLLPRNIILNVWCYDYIDPYPRSAFGNQKQFDILKRYTDLGFKVCVTTWCNFPHNVDTYKNYSDKYYDGIFSYRVTTWQMTAEQRLFTYPLLAFSGKTLRGEYPNDPYERLRASVRETFGVTEESEVEILCRACEKPYLLRAPLYYLNDIIVRRNVGFEDEYKEVTLLHALVKTLSVQNDIIETISHRIECTKLLYEVLIEAQKIIDKRSGERDYDSLEIITKLKALKERFTALYNRQYEMWDKYRHGVPTGKLDNERGSVIGEIDELLNTAEKMEFGKEPVLNMHVLLPDNSTCRFVDITVKYTDGTEKVLPRGIYKRIRSACYNIADKAPYFFTFSIMLDEGKVPEKVEIRTEGAGSFYLRYLYCKHNDITYLPTEVKAVGKYVEHPEHLLDFDTKFTSIGHPDMNKSVVDLDIFRAESGVDITLTEKLFY